MPMIAADCCSVVAFAQSFSVGGNSLQEAGVTAISDWFADHGQLRNLSVQRNMLGMPGVKALESMISSSTFEVPPPTHTHTHFGK